MPYVLSEAEGAGFARVGIFEGTTKTSTQAKEAWVGHPQML